MPDKSTVLANLRAGAARVPPDVWEVYLGRHGLSATSRLAADRPYLALLDAIYDIHQSGGGIHSLLDTLAAFAVRWGSPANPAYHAAIPAWQEALSGELRVVNAGLLGRVILPPRVFSGLRGQLRTGSGGDFPGQQYENWSTWSIRELLDLQVGSPLGSPPQPGGWGDRTGFHISFTNGGAGNQINHFALALRLYEYHRLPWNMLVGPIPPQDPPNSADGAATTAAYWLVRGCARARPTAIPPYDIPAIQDVLRLGLAAFLP